MLPGVLKRPIYRFVFGAKIAAGVRIGFGAILIFNELELERGSRIGALSLIRVHRLHLGPRARLSSFVVVDCHTADFGSATTVSPWVNIRADHRDPRATLRLGSESWILDNCYINPARPITLGRNVGVGGGSYVFAHGLWLSKLEGYPVNYAPITIGDNVWLPWGCFILPGVEIGSGAVVGARSLLNKSVPAGALVAGSPAKVIKEQVAVRPDIPTRNRMLLDATREFASFVDRQIDISDSDEWTQVTVGGAPLMVLAHSEASADPPSSFSDALCLVHTKYFEAIGVHPRILSLESYQSCAYENIGALQRQWLGYLRLIGFRFYPIDEVRIES